MGQLLGLVLLFVLLILLRLVLISWGWGLFMVPIFGLPELTLGQTFGLSLLMSSFPGSGTKVSTK